MVSAVDITRFLYACICHGSATVTTWKSIYSLFVSQCATTFESCMATAREAWMVELRNNRLQFINNTLIMCTRKLVPSNGLVQDTFITFRLLEPDRHKTSRARLAIDHRFFGSKRETIALHEIDSQCGAYHLPIYRFGRRDSSLWHRRSIHRRQQIFMCSLHPARVPTACACRVCVFAFDAKTKIADMWRLYLISNNERKSNGFMI